MVRLIALYSQPEDPAAFDAHYRDVHAPIVRSYPNLLSMRLTRADGVGGRPAAYYLMAEMSFATRADLDEAPLYYIDPDECIDCGACEPECPVTAIFAEDALPEQWNNFIQINADFFKK